MATVMADSWLVMDAAIPIIPPANKWSDAPMMEPEWEAVCLVDLCAPPSSSAFPGAALGVTPASSSKMVISRGVTATLESDWWAPVMRSASWPSTASSGLMVKARVAFTTVPAVSEPVKVTLATVKK